MWAGHTPATGFWFLHYQQPTPWPSPRGGSVILRRLNRGLMARQGPRLVGFAGMWGVGSGRWGNQVSYPAYCPRPHQRTFEQNLPPTPHPLPPAFPVSPDDLGLTPREIRGPCCTQIRDCVVVGGPTTGHRPRATSSAYHRQQTTNHVLRNRRFGPAGRPQGRLQPLAEKPLLLYYLSC